MVLWVKYRRKWLLKRGCKLRNVEEVSSCYFGYLSKYYGFLLFMINKVSASLEPPYQALELLVERAYNIDQPSSPAVAMRRLFEIVASGLFLKGAFEICFLALFFFPFFSANHQIQFIKPTHQTSFSPLKQLFFPLTFPICLPSIQSNIFLPFHPCPPNVVMPFLMPPSPPSPHRRARADGQREPIREELWRDRLPGSPTKRGPHQQRSTRSAIGRPQTGEMVRKLA